MTDAARHRRSLQIVSRRRRPGNVGAVQAALRPAARQIFHKVHAVDDVSFIIGKGETVGLVGESGCGKSTLVRALTRLIDVSDGSIKLGDRELARKTSRVFARDRDRARIQMVFQDAGESVNPRFTAFDAIADPLRRLRKLRGKALQRARRHRRAPMRAAARTVVALSASAFRRPARPRRHRPRHRGRARASGARRADRRARRLGAGRHPAAPAAAQARIRHELSVRLARSVRRAASVRPRAGHVSRKNRRIRPCRGSVRASAASLHAGAGRRGAAAARGWRRAAAAVRRADEPDRSRSATCAAFTAAARAVWMRARPPCPLCASSASGTWLVISPRNFCRGHETESQAQSDPEEEGCPRQAERPAGGETSALRDAEQASSDVPISSRTF